MDIRELRVGVAHYHPEPHHLPPNLADAKSSGEDGRNTPDPEQNLTTEVGVLSWHSVQHSAGPAWSTGDFSPPTGGFL